MHATRDLPRILAAAIALTISPLLIAPAHGQANLRSRSRRSASASRG